MQLEAQKTLATAATSAATKNLQARIAGLEQVFFGFS
jgi:hypothetical protein